jgi:hypothetical protein
VLPPLDWPDVLWRLAAVAVTLALSVGLLSLAGRVLIRSVSYQSLFVGALVIIGILVAAPQVVDLVLSAPWWPEQLRVAAEAGLIGGAALGGWIVAIEIVNQLLRRRLDTAKLKRIPEEEFVQTTVLMLADTRLPDDWAEQAEQAEQDWVDSPRRRRDLIWHLQWLADLLETYVPAKLSRLDADSSAHLHEQCRRRAAVIRRWNRDLVLGDDKIGSSVVDSLWDLAVIGLDRRWAALPEADAESVTQRSRKQVLGSLRRLVILLVPATGLVVALLMDRPELAGTAAVITGYVLLDLINPGSSAKLTEAASQTEKTLPNLRRS